MSWKNNKLLVTTLVVSISAVIILLVILNVLEKRERVTLGEIRTRTGFANNRPLLPGDILPK
jgi:hypothetical protein